MLYRNFQSQLNAAHCAGRKNGFELCASYIKEHEFGNDKNAKTFLSWAKEEQPHIDAYTETAKVVPPVNQYRWTYP